MLECLALLECEMVVSNISNSDALSSCFHTITSTQAMSTPQTVPTATHRHLEWFTTPRLADDTLDWHHVDVPRGADVDIDADDGNGSAVTTNGSNAGTTNGGDDSTVTTIEGNDSAVTANRGNAGTTNGEDDSAITTNGGDDSAAPPMEAITVQLPPTEQMTVR